MHDEIYFIETYCYINTLDKGKILFALTPHQKRWIKRFNTRRVTEVEEVRQTGRSSILAAHIAYKTVFSPDHITLIVGDRYPTALHIHNIIKPMIANLPDWMIPEITCNNQMMSEYNKSSKIFCQAASSSTGRGMAFNLLVIDNYGHIKQNIKEELYDGLMPTMVGNSSAIIVGDDTGWAA